MTDKLPVFETFEAANRTVTSVLKSMVARMKAAGLHKAGVSLVCHTDGIPSFLIYREEGAAGSICVQGLAEAEAEIDEIVAQIWSPSLVAATLGMECGA